MSIKERIFLPCAVLAGVCLIFLRDAVADGIRNALSLSGEILIPSLLPFMVLSSFTAEMWNSHSGSFADKFMKKLFRLPAECAQVLFFGFTGGYPVGMSLAGRLYEKGSISEEEAEYISCFCVNAGPAFVVSVAGGAAAGSVKAGVVLLCATEAAALITGIVYARRRPCRENGKPLSVNKTEPSSALVGAVKSSQENILSVCMWVAVFSVFTSVTASFIKNDTLLLVLSSVAEVTAGVSRAMQAGGLPLAAAAISFGGLSVMCQLIPVIKKCGIRIYKFLIFRIINGILSYFITELLLCFVDIEIQTLAENASVFSSNAPASAALLIMGAVLISDVSRSEILTEFFHHRQYQR